MMGPIDFCNETDIRHLITKVKETARDFDIIPLYTYLCPVIIFICFFSITFNAILITISRQSQLVNKSPILLLSLNLAVTDLIASFLNGLSILFNSYLNEVYNINLGPCSLLIFEVLRCAALVASALHLLALAFVHYRGIVNPLHYRSTIFFSQHLSRTINIISIICWTLPLTIMIIVFTSTPCQGFRSKDCDYLFLLGFTFRYVVLTLFALPLFLMSAIYLRIFIIISKHQKGRRLNHERSTLSRGAISATGPIGTPASINLPELMSTERNSIVLVAADGNNSQIQHQHRDGCLENDDETNNGNRNGNGTTSAIGAAVAAASIASASFVGGSSISCGGGVGGGTSLGLGRSSSTYEPQRRHIHASAVPQTNTKALVTTLLILGTYFFSYVPAILMLVLTCVDYCPYPLYDVSFSKRILFGSITAFLLIGKSIIDPFIYSYRMSEIQVAVNRYISQRRSNNHHHHHSHHHHHLHHSSSMYVSTNQRLNMSFHNQHTSINNNSTNNKNNNSNNNCSNNNNPSNQVNVSVNSSNSNSNGSNKNNNNNNNNSTNKDDDQTFESSSFRILSNSVKNQLSSKHRAKTDMVTA